ncbi:MULTISPECIES: DUF3080 family protein [Marinomonas]|uniref:DUF3080 family protein n=1 Tax=Marinomonas TaxID=28253 RepID=UPI001FB7F523|nr:DUF3080 family protein [Marinomonas sp. KMM3893]
MFILIRIFPQVVWAIALGCLLLLTGCTSRYQPESLLMDYVKDLSRSKYIQLVVPDFVSPSLYPPLHQRQQALTKFDVSILDFLSLQQCDVGFLVGEKNSVLGKVMPASQRFLYEINIIRAIESCHIGNVQLAEKLNAIAKIKRQELPVAFTNAVFNGAEGKDFFSLSNGFLPLKNDLTHYQVLLASLRDINALGANLSSLPKLEGKAFEEDLKALSDSEYAGQLIYSLAQLSRFLSVVSEAIEDLPEGVCGPPVTFLKQQFERHYIKIIQPYMAKINATAYQILPLIRQAAVYGQPLPKALDQYLSMLSLDQKEGLWGRYQRASQRHAQAWSRLFNRCDIALSGIVR